MNVIIKFSPSHPSFIKSMNGNMDLNTTISIDDHPRKIRPYNIDTHSPT